MRLSEKGIEFLKSIETFRSKPYDDQTGKDVEHWVKGATIGYGHLISWPEWELFGRSYKRAGITQCVGEWMFASDLQPFVDSVNERVHVVVAQNQFDALVILAFNIGIGNFGSSSALKLINNPSAQTSYPNLEAAWKAWKKSQGRVMQGLINRRHAEWRIYSEGVYERW